jgi:hypothetical protein
MLLEVTFYGASDVAVEVIEHKIGYLLAGLVGYFLRRCVSCCHGYPAYAAEWPRWTASFPRKNRRAR